MFAKYHILFWALGAMAPALLAAEAPAPPAAASPAGETDLLSRGGVWLESGRDRMTSLFTDSAQWLDQMMGGDYYDANVINESYFRLQLRQRFDSDDDRGQEVKLKVKLDLPSASRRFKLIFDTSPEDFSSLAEKGRDSVEGSRSRGELRDQAIGGVSIEETERVWQRRLDVGVRLHSSLDPFARIHFTREWQRQHWYTGIRHSVSYFHRGGAKYSADMEWLRPLGERFYFQSSSAAQFLDEDNSWELYQSVSLHQLLSPDSVISYQAGVSAFSRPAMRIDGYWLRAKWHHLLYEDWLFLNLSPELAFVREDDFDISPALLVELEVFGRHKGQYRSIHPLFD